MIENGLYRQVVFIWRLLCFNFNKEGLLKCGLYSQGGLYSEVAFNTGLTVCFSEGGSKTASSTSMKIKQEA